MTDPEALKRFEESSHRIRDAIAESDKFRRTDLALTTDRYDLTLRLLKLTTETDEKFIWHRDLLPLARSAAILLFVEIMAGVMIGISRRQDALALHWTTRQREVERMLALPGAVATMKTAGIELTEPLLKAFGSAEPAPSPMHLPEENPTVEGLRALIAAMTQAKQAK